jgi:hypothetical protein
MIHTIFYEFHNIVTCHLKTGTHFEKCVIKQFHYHVNIKKYTYTNTMAMMSLENKIS